MDYFHKLFAVCLLATFANAYVKMDCDDLRVAYCKVDSEIIDENGFEEISYPNLPSLKIAHSTYPFLTSKLLEIFPSLNKLDIIDSGLNGVAADTFSKNVDILEYLNLEANNLVTIPDKMFYGAYHLVSLDLGSNKISEIGENVFVSSPGLKKINLGNNQISILPSTLFYSTENLTTINLSFNRIESIPAHLFLKNTKLISIRLENNHIRYIYPSEFYHLTKIVEFNIRNNPLVRYLEVNAPNITMPGVGAVGAFIGKVSHYDVHNNEIYYIVVDVIQRTGFLSLNFCRNYLSDLRNLTLLSNIKYADFSYNLLTTINFRHFATSEKIVRIYLNDNQIRYIIPNTFPFKYLEVLDLSNNYITRLSIDFFRTIPFVHEFYLDNNHLTSFDITQIGGASFFEYLKILGITKNKWNCDYIQRTVHGFTGLEFKNIESGVSFLDGVGCTNDIVIPDLGDLSYELYYKIYELNDNWKLNIQILRESLEKQFAEQLKQQFLTLSEYFNKKVEFIITDLGAQCGCCKA